MAIEAISLGFRTIHINDLALARIQYIRKQLSIMANASLENVYFYARDYLKMKKVFLEKEKVILFIDLPFSFWKNKKAPIHLENFLSFFASIEAIEKEASHSIGIFIQTPVPLLQEKFPSEVRRYGKQYLNFRFYSITWN